MTPLEKEFYKDYKEDIENGNSRSIKKYIDKWLDRPEDLDKLVRSGEYLIRAEVAYIGRDRDLDNLVHDPSEYVRYFVAEQGRPKDLEVLVSDGDWDVRETAQRRLEEKA